MLDTMHFWLCRMTVCSAILLPLLSSAQPVPEYELKAAFVYNFALFTDWPQDTDFDGGTLNICINPASALRQPLSGLSDKIIKGRKVAVRYLSSLDKLHACHILFIDGSDRDRWGQIKKGLSNNSVLTISNDDETSQDGSIITFAMGGNRIVFDINMRAAKQARLGLSSKLLRLARTVR